MLIPMNNDFRIGLRAKNVSIGLQFAPQLFEIIDFAIEHHPHGFSLIRHWLVAPAEVDNGEPSKAEAERAGNEKSFIIWTSMDQRSSHSLDVIKLNRTPIPKVVLPANATHRID